ncbi:RNA polymerase sigma factor [Silvibacterium sp.]|uniref:RNA polymerase sigma factor n=1 Tax=Silvibacterium sp. TaxID=1964179 RepID=UPI0039E71780
MPAEGTGVRSDLSLLLAIRKRDQGAMTELFDKYGSLVYSVAFRVLRDESQAQDVVQDVFFQTWQSARDWSGEQGSLAAWFAVVARNRAIDLLRRRRYTDNVDEVILASPCNVESEAERIELVARVRTELQSFPPEQQKLLELAFFEGLTHAEIAERTGDPLGTIKTRIRLGLNRLRKALGR